MPVKSERKTVVVLGGGVLGVSTALQLVKKGAQVTLVTEAALCSGASGRSLSWLNSAGERSAEYHALRMMGIDRYRTLFAEDPARDWLRFDGGLFWAANDTAGTLARHAYEKAHGYDSHVVDAHGIAEIDSAVNPAAPAECAIVNPGEGWVSLPDLIRHLHQQFQALGGEVIEHAGKAEVMTDKGRACGIHCQKGTFRADAVLVACGPWTPDVVAPLGVAIPNGSPVSMLAISQPVAQSIKLVMNTPRAAVRPNPGSTIAVDHDWYEEQIVPQPDGGYTIAESVVDQLMEEAGALIGRGAPLHAQSWKLGLKPIPGDGEPVLGELQKVPGCFVAFTHSGATLALIVGELLADEIVDGKQHPMLATFRAERFH
ncbi:FAD-binding oxidoreductase [Serratia sp. JUb9]|uniref:NAD(P)/FAD-dependent oxidoreductase n=1 Tax=unclassified Serratia (in: enterobacteria) TaxID=2647522 RepID=UPI000CF6A61E|nr:MULTISPECIES: FAD-binding oxidoreductase [unclassified Serratia (in: enterobacteria)]MCA4823903.1 FAD-binding oxidoreductase [Serratia rubidaea]AVJ18385.1 D-amino-acid oxidase [Serratia sp. MYb239]QNK34117.1 FAD-binding oxidoreductase [Serratia sp. JUb9]QPT11976.1 FAD-binding oxidoreductase [Serratia rubidaea]CAE1147660.1 D-amino-acid oxidase [Serratia sp. Tan611]